MTQFDESKIRRDGEGKFASKGPAAEAEDVSLGASHEQSVKRALRIVSQYDLDSTDQRGYHELRRFKQDMQTALEAPTSTHARAEGWESVAISRREGIGLRNEAEAKKVMEAIAPNLSADEREASYQTIKSHLDRAQEFADGDPERTQADLEIAEKFSAIGNDRGGMFYAYVEAARYESERAVNCDSERGNPRVYVAPAQELPEGESIEGRLYSDPYVTDRRRERSEISDLAMNAGDQVVPDGKSYSDMPPSTFTSENLAETDGVKDVSSVLVQRGLHPHDAEAHAVKIARARSLATWYEEGGEKAMSQADEYDYDNRKNPAHEKVVLADSDDFKEGDYEPSPAYGGGYEYNFEVGVNHDDWARANADSWNDETNDSIDAALGYGSGRRA